jgi:hypothetical protein
MVVDVRVIRVMSDSSLKVAKGASGVPCRAEPQSRGLRQAVTLLTELHVNTGDLDPTLNKARDEVETLLKIRLRSKRVTDKEPIRASA